MEDGGFESQNSKDIESSRRLENIKYGQSIFLFQIFINCKKR